VNIFEHFIKGHVVQLLLKPVLLPVLGCVYSMYIYYPYSYIFPIYVPIINSEHVDIFDAELDKPVLTDRGFYW